MKTDKVVELITLVASNNISVRNQPINEWHNAIL